MTRPVKAKLSFVAPRLSTLDTRTAQPPPKVADPELLTPEHRRWRAEVIRRAGGMCQGKGCGRTGVRLFADHIVERQDGGARLDPANGQAMCQSCHGKKTVRERAKRQAIVYQPLVRD